LRRLLTPKVPRIILPLRDFLSPFPIIISFDSSTILFGRMLTKLTKNFTFIKIIAQAGRKKRVVPRISSRMTYCEYIKTISGETQRLHTEYHDNHYGFPIADDDLLFERLMFEINQAGLNWILILKKQDNFRKAFSSFSIEKVAAYGEADRARLMNDTGIIRNRLKINAAIENARIIMKLREETGSFKNWLEINALEMKDLNDWTRLFRKTFRFTGGEIVNEFLMSTGYLPGAHSPDCPVFRTINKLKEK
jgi:DNA-3-methyladenine glycosylase I